MSRLFKTEDCRRELLDAYFVDGEYYDKVLINIARRRSKLSVESHIREYEQDDEI